MRIGGCVRICLVRSSIIDTKKTPMAGGERGQSMRDIRKAVAATNVDDLLRLAKEGRKHRDYIAAERYAMETQAILQDQPSSPSSARSLSAAIYEIGYIRYLTVSSVKR